MKNSVQIRVRLPRQDAARWLTLPPSVRSKAVAFVLHSADNISLQDLIVMRRQLVSLGTLLNQSLAVSSGLSVDEEALKECIGLLKRLSAK